MKEHPAMYDQLSASFSGRQEHHKMENGYHIFQFNKILVLDSQHFKRNFGGVQTSAQTFIMKFIQEITEETFTVQLEIDLTIGWGTQLSGAHATRNGTSIDRISKDMFVSLQTNQCNDVEGCNKQHEFDFRLKQEIQR